MPQKSPASFFVNERGKASAFWAPPGMQLNHMMAVINAFLKRWRVPHFSNRGTIHLGLSNRNSQESAHVKMRMDRFSIRLRLGSIGIFFVRFPPPHAAVVARRRSVQVLARPQVAADVYGAASRKHKDVRGNNFPLVGKKPVRN